MKKICFSQFQNRDRVYFRFSDFQIFLIVEFFFMVARCRRAAQAPQVHRFLTRFCRTVPMAIPNFQDIAVNL